MSAPLNDLSASATSITALFGALVGTNISASVEAGEPNWGPNPNFLQPKVEHNSPNSSVWVLWSPIFPSVTGSYDIYFTTRATTGSAYTNFPTVVQLYNWSPVGGLGSEVPYISDFCAGVGDEYGALAAFTYTTASNTQIMVRVSSRYPNKQGNFVLAWGNYNIPSLGDCNSCPPTFTPGETCIGQFHVNDVKTNQVTNMLYKGAYTIFPNSLLAFRYCKGYYSDVNWIVQSGCSGPDGVDPCCMPIGFYATNYHIYLSYTGSTTAGSASVIFPQFPFIPISYTSPIQVQTQTNCSQIMLAVRSGSNIQVTWPGSQFPVDCTAATSAGGCPIEGEEPYFKEIYCPFPSSIPTGSVGLNGIAVNNGNPNPTYGLYSIQPALAIINNNGEYRNACTDQYTASFVIKNLGNASWGSCSFQLLNTGVVSGAPSVSQSMGDIPTYGGTVGSPTVAFHASNGNNPFTINANVYSNFYGNGFVNSADNTYQYGARLSDLGLPPITASISYVMNPRIPTGFVENGTSGITRTSDALSGSFKVNYTGLTGGDFYGGCGVYTASLRTNTNVTIPNGPVSVFNSSATAQTIPFSFKASPTGETRLSCLVDIQDNTGTILKTLSYDLTPIITVDENGGGFGPVSLPCGYSADTWKLTFRNVGLGPTVALSLTTSASMCITAMFPQTGLAIAGNNGSVTFGDNSSHGTTFIQNPFSVHMVDGPFDHGNFLQP